MTTMKKANHQANIVKITEILPHNNADSLEIIPIGEYQVVSRKGQFKVGDVGIYIQPDSVVPITEPFKFIWEPYMCVPDVPGANFTVPEKRRRITVKKLRGEWSEGLLMPLSDFCLEYDGNEVLASEAVLTKNFVITNKSYQVGEDVSDRIGITHYDPDSGKGSIGDNEKLMNAPKRKRRYPKTLKGWWSWLLSRLRFKRDERNFAEANSLQIPTYDVEGFKNYPNIFKEGEPVYVTEKIHGSNARFVYVDGVQYAGSRNLWKSQDSTCAWRQVLKQQPWIGELCQQFPGYVFWGELTPTQEKYNYGCKPKEYKFFLFDVYSPEGKWLNKTYDYDEAGYTEVCYGGFIHVPAFNNVPLLYTGPFDKAVIQSKVDGFTTVQGDNHIRESVVINSQIERHERGVGRAQLKIVSSVFLEKDNK